MSDQELLSPRSADVFAPITALVLDSVSSPLTRKMYGKALTDFLEWWRGQAERPSFDRATVQRYRTHLESLALAPASINQKLSAVRKLAREAAYSGLLEVSVAQGIRDVKGARQQGVRTGNWLAKNQAEAILQAPDFSTLKGKRDRAILAMLIGCGLRREEAARLSVAHIQLRDSRWCVVDLIGKHGRIRSVPMPHWAKAMIDEWTVGAGITSGRVFRGVNKGDQLTGDSLTPQGILRCVEKYNAEIAPHDLRRTFAKLSYKGGAKLDQIQLSLGHSSIQTTERYLGVQQDLSDAPCDYLHLDLKL
jgi:site-specific recombinase XerD